MVRTAVRQDVWAIMRSTYGILTAEPSSEKQEELLDRISGYVAEKLAAKLTREELQELLDVNRPA
jgi:hypothetical protein